MPPTGRPAERRLAAVERALRVLDAFLDAPGELGTNELARATGINASTVSRTLATLTAAGYVEHLPSSGRYRLGAHLLTLANHALAGLDLRTIARPHLQQLQQATGETSTLSVPGEHDAVTVDFVVSPAAVASVARVGRPSVAHATATGKVMLAFGPSVPRGRPLERYTDRTIVERRGARPGGGAGPPAGLGRRRRRARGRPERRRGAGVRGRRPAGGDPRAAGAGGPVRWSRPGCRRAAPARACRADLSGDRAWRLTACEGSASMTVTRMETLLP